MLLVIEELCCQITLLPNRFTQEVPSKNRMYTPHRCVYIYSRDSFKSKELSEAVRRRIVDSHKLIRPLGAITKQLQIC